MAGPFWVGTEDLEYAPIGGASISTTAGKFNPARSRCALETVPGPGVMHQSITPYSKTSFWFTAAVTSNVLALSLGNAVMLSFLDGSNVERIRIVGYGASGSQYFKVQLVDALLHATDVGNIFYWPVSATSKLDKIDVHIVNDAAGSIDIYINGIYVFAFLGDTRTDGNTTLCYHRLGNHSVTSHVYWSETFLSDDDTRSQFIVGFDPVANGHANTFDIGSPSAANINDIVNSDATLNGASSAGLIDQYTNGAVPSNTLNVIALFVSARAQKGASGPSKIALGVRTNSTDYWGSDQPQDVAWDNPQQVFLTNPDTGVAWLKTEIGAALGFNVGSKSVT